MVGFLAWFERTYLLRSSFFVRRDEVDKRLSLETDGRRSTTCRNVRKVEIR